MQETTPEVVEQIDKEQRHHYRKSALKAVVMSGILSLLAGGTSVTSIIFERGVQKNISRIETMREQGLDYDAHILRSLENSSYFLLGNASITGLASLVGVGLMGYNLRKREEDIKR